MQPTVQICKSLPHGSAVKSPPAGAGDVDSIPGSGRSPGEGNGNPLQFSCLGNAMDGQRSLVGSRPQNHKELDTAEQPSTHAWICHLVHPGTSRPRRGFAASVGGIIDGLPPPAFLVHQPSFTDADATPSTLSTTKQTSRKYILWEKIIILLHSLYLSLEVSVQGFPRGGGVNGKYQKFLSTEVVSNISGYRAVMEVKVSGHLKITK